MGVLGAISSFATGGAYSTDGGGWAQGGTGYGTDLKEYIPGVGDAEAAKKQNEQNRKEAALNRDFQERMSSTAYQRAMQDMKKAGLNPMLAYQQGGASAPSGSQATYNSESKTGLANMALQAYTGINSARAQQQQISQQGEMNQSAIQLNKTSAAKNLQEAEKTRLDNVKQKKFEPLNEKMSEVTSSVSKTFDKLIQGVSNTAKKIGAFHTPMPVQGRKVQVLDKNVKNPHTFKKPSQN